MILFALVSRDPASAVSAASGIARVWEEYGPEQLVIVHTPGVRQRDLDALVEWSARLIPRDGIVVERVDSTPEALLGRSDDVLARRLGELVHSYCGGGRGVMLVSSGSRRLASAAVLAGLYGGSCDLDIVHVHFYFGPWMGLPYPYTPLRLQPLIVMNGSGPGGPEGRSAASRMYEAMSEAAAKLVLGPLPPLRSVVAELARRVNEAAGSGFVLPRVEEPRCGKLVLESSRLTIPAADLCDARGLANMASRLAGYLIELEHDLGKDLRSVLAWTGLAHLQTEEGEQLPSMMLREKTVVDSSIVYYGAHRYFWEGADIYIPECLIREIHLNLAETVKSRRSRQRKGIADILAYLGLKDMLESGVPVIPTAPGHCDTSIPKIDPLILEGKVLITSDSGAIRYWRSHPTRRIVKSIVKVAFDPEASLQQKVDPRDPASLARLLYSIYQTIISVELMVKLRMLEEREGIRVSVVAGEERRRISVPSRTLLKALGF